MQRLCRIKDEKWIQYIPRLMLTTVGTCKDCTQSEVAKNALQRKLQNERGDLRFSNYLIAGRKEKRLQKEQKKLQQKLQNERRRRNRRNRSYSRSYRMNRRRRNRRNRRGNYLIKKPLHWWRIFLLNSTDHSISYLFVGTPRSTRS